MKDFYLILNYFLTFISVVCLHFGKCIEKKNYFAKIVKFDCNLLIIFSDLS